MADLSNFMQTGVLSGDETLTIETTVEMSAEQVTVQDDAVLTIAGEGQLNISGIPPLSIGRADPLPYTLLSLERYARILGVNPVHFQGGYSDSVWPLKGKSCGEIWTRHSWQLGDRVSHEDLTQAIAAAEEQIAEYTNFPVAPQWVHGEGHSYPENWDKRQRRRGFSGNTISTQYFNITDIGRRTVRFLSIATVSNGMLEYLDADGDGFNELAKITIPIDAGVKDKRNVKLYVPGKLGDQEWEIKTPIDITLNSAAGEAVIHIRSWLLVDPDAQSAYPTDDVFRALDLNDPANMLQRVEVFYEYADPAHQVEFLWQSDGCGHCRKQLDDCHVCGFTREWGCGYAVSEEDGIVAVSPGTFDATTDSWLPNDNFVCGKGRPDRVVIYYRAGYTGERRVTSRKLDVLSEQYALAVAMLATARVNKAFCGCPSVTRKANYWQQNAAMSTSEATFFVNFEELRNPFGTKIGEMLAWNIVGKSPSSRRVKAALL